MSPLEQLLVVQEHDSAADHLRHRRATLPEREVLRAGPRPRLPRCRRSSPTPARRRDEVVREVKRLDDESAAVTARVKEVEKTMYSGSISSPRELTGDAARRRAAQPAPEVARRPRARRSWRARSCSTPRSAGSRSGWPSCRRAADEARAALVEQEAVIDAELATELEARGAAAGAVPPDLLALYEQVRQSSTRRRCRPAHRQHVPGVPAHDPGDRGRPHPPGRSRRDGVPLRQLRRHPRPHDVTVETGDRAERRRRSGKPGSGRDRCGGARRDGRSADGARDRERVHRHRHQQRGRVPGADLRARSGRDRSVPGGSSCAPTRSCSSASSRVGTGSRARTLKPLYEQARALLAEFDEVDLGHVRRENNVDADALVNAALDAVES